MDQLRALTQAPRLGGTRGGQVSLDLGQHPRQRDGEGEEGSVEIRGVVHVGSYALAFEANDQRPAGVGRLKNAA